MSWPRVHCFICGEYNCWWIKFNAVMVAFFTVGILMMVYLK